jgi:hypothetical protein
MTTTDSTTDTLSAKIAAIVDQLANATDAARVAETMTRFLETAAQFHSYSWGNQMLIASSRPDATRVAGYQTWRGAGRQVRRGERGIAILAPVITQLKDESGEPAGNVRVSFKTVHVFDVAQTDGEPLPEPPAWTSPEQDTALAAGLTAFAIARGIQVIVGELPGQTQGASCGGTILLSPTAGTKTLIHELAHEMLHQHLLAGLLPRQTVELQAESVAYVVARHFGLEPAGSPNYLALWGAEGRDIRATLATIQRCAAEIIGAIEEAPANG